MRLDQYPGYNSNRRGIHWVPASGHAHADLTWALDKCRDMGLAWMCLLDDGGGSTLQQNFYYGTSIIDMLLQRNIEPVVRFYASANARLDARMKDAAARLVEAGVHYIFWQNEPEVGGNEYPNRPDNWVEECTRTFVAGAYELMSVGAYPGMWATTTWLYPDADGNPCNPWLSYMSAQERADIFINGPGWLAAHPYSKNHPENYPRDDVNLYGKHLTSDEYGAKLAEVSPDYRARTGNLWVWENWQTSEHHINLLRDAGKNPAATIRTDDVCWHMWQGLNILLDEAGLLDYVPIIATEC